MPIERDREGLQGAAREVNDRVAQLRVDAERDELDFLCECGAKDCVATLKLTPNGYAELRQLGPILKPGHVALSPHSREPAKRADHPRAAVG